MLARLTFLRSSSPELLEKKIYPKVYEHIKISEREFTAAKEKKLLKMISSRVWFFENPVSMTTIYPEQSRQLKRSRL